MVSGTPAESIVPQHLPEVGVTPLHPPPLACSKRQRVGWLSGRKGVSVVRAGAGSRGSLFGAHPSRFLLLRGKLASESM